MRSDPVDEQLGAVIDELYALPLASFITERNAHAKAARSAGDRPLAARITALPKPSASASLVNELVRGDELAVQRVLDLGVELREAQDANDRTRLRELSTRRRDLLAEITRAVAGRAEDDGRRVSASVLEEFQQTLQAALVSEDAARAVRTGCLLRALEADGLDPVDLTDAVAGSGEVAPRARRSAPAPSDAPSDADRPDAAAEAAAEAAEERARAEARAEAERRAQDARQEADDAAESADQAAALVADRQQALDRLEAQLTDLRAAVEAATQELAAASATAVEAAATASEAASAADAAEATAREP